MSSKNEMIFVNRILTSELSIRKAAKQFGLRRDDLISRIRNMIGNDEENQKQLDLIIALNKMMYDHLKIEDVAKELGMTVQELDKKILKTLENNKDKKQKYLEYKKSVGVKCKDNYKSKKNTGVINNSYSQKTSPITKGKMKSNNSKRLNSKNIDNSTNRRGK